MTIIPKYYKYLQCNDGKQYDLHKWYHTVEKTKPYKGLVVYDQKHLLYGYGESLVEVEIEGDVYETEFSLYVQAFKATQSTYMTKDRWFQYANDCMWRFYNRHAQYMENWVFSILKTMQKNPGIDVLSGSPIKQIIQDVTLNFTEAAVPKSGDSLFYLLCAISRFGAGEAGFFANHALACLYELDNYNQWYINNLLQYIEK